MQIEREPCSQCAEPVALDAQSCPHCGSSALVRVALSGPVGDPRLRYHVARGVAARAVPLGPVNAVTAALAAPSPKLGPVTRSAGYRILEVLDGAGLSGTFEPVPAGRPARVWRWVGAGLTATSLIAVYSLLGRTAAPSAIVPRTSPTRAPASAPAAPVRATTPLTAREVAARVIPSTVLIRCDRSLGSGFVVAPETVLTAAHVLCGGTENPTVSTPAGASRPGFPLEKDEALDLAVMRVPGLEASALPLADAAVLAPGDRVMAVGNPLGLEFTVSEGIVSSPSQIAYGVSYIQTDVKLNPGNSGGPLVDDQGRVVGVVSMKVANAEGLGFAVPVNYAWERLHPGVTAPAEVDSERWRQIVARADDANREMSSEVSSALALPVLLGAITDRYGRLVVRIGRASSIAPGFEEVTLRAYRGSEVVCTLKGDVSEWKPTPPGRSSDARLQAWLDANNLAQNAWIGEAPLRIDLCPPGMSGTELVLENGNPTANRLRLY
ncbi:MAG: trypsin-like peptidase domain-containing protein [Vicinamibacteria bacterium]